MVVMRMNGKEMGDTGLVCAIDTGERGISLFDAMGDIRPADVSGNISVNGEIIPEGYLSFDSETCRGQFSGKDMPYRELDLKKIYIEVNIFGDIDI